MQQKPKKIIYENQEEVHSLIINYLKSILPKDITKAYLWGSAVERTFGKYVEKYGSHDGSDIDVIVIINKEKIPSVWKYLNTEKDWWKLYRGGKIEINKIFHKVDLIVVKEGYEDYLKNKIKEEKWNVELIK